MKAEELEAIQRAFDATVSSASYEFGTTVRNVADDCDALASLVDEVQRGVNDALRGHDKQLAALEGKLHATMATLESRDARIATVAEAQRDTQAMLEARDARIAALESKLETFEARLDEQRVHELELLKELRTLRALATTPSTEVDQLRASIDRHEAEVRVALMESRSNALEYRGVWEPGCEYHRNSCVTHDGSMWIALESTTAKPGDAPSSWRLAVKKGRPGKIGPHELAAIAAEVAKRLDRERPSRRRNGYDDEQHHAAC